MFRVSKLEEKLKTLFSHGPERTVKARKNITAMVLIKGGSILVGLLIVPLTLTYVDNDTYGIWLSLSSMVAWFSFFDIGINNGLKNRLTEALAKNDIQLAKKYVSTTYALMMLIFIPLMILLLGLAPLLDWQSILNLHQNAVEGLLASTCIIIAYFCINFVLSTINVVMTADQYPAGASLQTFLQQLCSLIVIYLLTLFTKGSLLNLCIGLCLGPIIVVSLFNVILFSGKYKSIAPRLSDVDFSVAPDLFKLGVRFFVIQIAGIIQYQMANFLIIRYFGAGDVTEYNIAYKYFNVPFLLWATIITPVWAAVTDAIAKDDYEWISGMVQKYLKYLLIFVVAELLLLLLSNVFYNIWIGDKVNVHFDISLWMMIFNVVMMFGSIFVNVLNGAGILRVQVLACIISPLVFIALFVLFKNMGWGVKSIIIASIIANFNGLILAPVQCSHWLKTKRQTR